MESPRIGVVRESMLHRPLLIKPSLGAVKSRGFIPPGPDHVYGTANVIHDGGVGEAISQWQTHTVCRHKLTERDFISLNREGVKLGLVSAKQLHQYRATNDIQRLPVSKERFRRSAPPRLHPDALFGMSNRPSTPISDLLEYKYAQKWLEEQQARDRERQAHQYMKIGPAVDTFRDPEARRKAMIAHYSESASRRGILGQGIYNVDK